MEWSTKCVDWETRITAGLPLVPTEYPSPARAAKALAIFKRLRITDIPGAPAFGDVCAPWVFEFVAAIFGAFDEKLQQQIAQDILLLIAKKNGKSTIAAGVMVTALLMHTRREE